MNYLSKIDAKSLAEFKKKKGSMTMRLRLALWIRHLSNYDNFVEHFGYPKEGQTYIKEELTNHKSYTIKVDKWDWTLFKMHCRNDKMSCNYAINELIIQYITEGALFNVKIEA